ncbi:MAG: hypothetical protein ACRDMV_06690 [Streptosporangiales bacterium]
MAVVWHVVILVIIVLVIVGVVAAIVRTFTRSSRSGTDALRTELARIDQRLTAIENTLNDVNTN